MFQVIVIFILIIISGNLSSISEIDLKNGGSIEVLGCADYSNTIIHLDTSNSTSTDPIHFSKSNLNCSVAPKSSSVRGIGTKNECFHVLKKNERYLLSKLWDLILYQSIDPSNRFYYAKL